MIIIDIHTHIFTLDYIPDNYIPNKYLRFLVKYKLIYIVCKIYFLLYNLKIFKKLNKYYNFLKICSLKTQEDVFNYIKINYPENSIFGILAIDFDYLDAGKSNKNYIQQLDELVKLKLKYDNIKIFMCVDPRRENYLELVKKYIIDHNFTGIKLYPPFGFYPFDKRLYKLYKWCEENEIPITTHCGKSFIHYNGDLKKEWKKHPITNEIIKFRNKKECLGNLANPENFKYVLDDFPKLKINLSHLFKINNKNTKDIIDLMEKYENVYTDISFSLTNDKFLEDLKFLMETNTIINKKILFGSDLFLIRINDKINFEFLQKVKDVLGEKNFIKISYFNNMRFLSKK